jgi:hypothetical protein
MEIKNMFSLKEEKKKRAINIGTAVVMDGVKTNKTDLVDAFAQGLKTQVEPQSHTSPEQNLMYKEPSSATTQFDSQDMEDIASHIGARNINFLIAERTKDEPKRFAYLFKRMCKILDVNIQRVFEAIHTPKIWKEAQKFASGLMASLDRIETRFTGWFERKFDSVKHKKMCIAVGVTAFMLLATPLSPLYGLPRQFITDVCTFLPPGTTIKVSEVPNQVHSHFYDDEDFHVSQAELKVDDLSPHQVHYYGRDDLYDKDAHLPEIQERYSCLLAKDITVEKTYEDKGLQFSNWLMYLNDSESPIEGDAEEYFEREMAYVIRTQPDEITFAMGILRDPNDILIQHIALGLIWDYNYANRPPQKDVEAFVRTQIQKSPIVATFANMVHSDLVKTQHKQQNIQQTVSEETNEDLMLKGQPDELVGRAMLALSQTTDTETYFKQALPILSLQNQSDAICAMGILHRPNDITLQRFALGSEETPTQEDVDSFLQAQIQNCPIVARFADMASPNYVRKLSAETFDKNRGEISTEMFCGYSDEISF